jgi:hypothetical protein
MSESRFAGWDGTEGFIGYDRTGAFGRQDEGHTDGTTYDTIIGQARLAAAPPAEAASPDRLAAARDRIDEVLGDMGVAVEDRPGAPASQSGNRITLPGAGGSTSVGFTRRRRI